MVVRVLVLSQLKEVVAAVHTGGPEIALLLKILAEVSFAASDIENVDFQFVVRVAEQENCRFILPPDS